MISSGKSPRRIVVAPDSFKGSLTAWEATEAICEGIAAALPEVELVRQPLADGGEGTARILAEATGGEMHPVLVCGPLGDPVNAEFGISGDHEIVFLEMASASGLILIPEHQRNPLHTTTYGTGELIRDALDRGARRILVGIGGSATTDGGCGMAQALGVRFHDRDGEIQSPITGADLERIVDIDMARLDPRIAEATLEVACDVTNPLLGPQGAAHVYGPQKGANEEAVQRLERGMTHAYELIERVLDRRVRDIPGAGAAGGLGAGLLAFLGAELRSGVSLVLDALKFDKVISSEDLIITGEGRFDEQSGMGKLISGVLGRATPLGVPVWVFAGEVGLTEEEVRAAGFAGAVQSAPPDLPRDEAMHRAGELLKEAAHRWASAL